MKNRTPRDSLVGQWQTMVVSGGAVDHNFANFLLQPC
jgi:hypothetical protein